MSFTELGLRPASPGSIPCKICAEPSPVYGVVDLNQPCEIPGSVRPHPAGHTYLLSPLRGMVTCFETLEHLPDPVAGIAEIIDCVAEPGAVLYSTIVQPPDFDKQGMSWWYIAPRNGHISIFTRQALAIAWSRYGYSTVSVDDSLHFAFRTLPEHWGLKIPKS